MNYPRIATGEDLGPFLAQYENHRKTFVGEGLYTYDGKVQQNVKQDLNDPLDGLSPADLEIWND
jgi:hypothetical protein